MPEKITFAEMRSAGVYCVLVYCSDQRRSHWTRLGADRWPDDVRLSNIEPSFVCTAFGRRGAHVRPDFPEARMGTSQTRFSAVQCLFYRNGQRV